jgi:cytoplasmic iron level regulating protein YaaA (DUF328/UPF0246 family)
VITADLMTVRFLPRSIPPPPNPNVPGYPERRTGAGRILGVHEQMLSRYDRIVAVLVLLPPSETKSHPSQGRTIDLERLSFPGLNEARELVLDRLVSLCSDSPELARKALGLSIKQDDEIHRNQHLRSAPCAPAHQIYTGVLYEALDRDSLDEAAQRRANRMLIVSSALFGAVGFGDRIPAYRLSGDSVLPHLGSMNSYWRDPLAAAMTDAVSRGLIVDLRSGVYASMWKPTAEFADRTVTIRVLQERPDGSRAVVSHFNKATKGRLVRRWLVEGVKATSAEALADACISPGVAVELGPRTSKGQPRTCDVIVRDL